MNCVMCKATLSQEVLNHIVDINGSITIVKDVPANVCKQCGENYIDSDVARNLDAVMEEIQKGGAEVTIISYSSVINRN